MAKVGMKKNKKDVWQQVERKRDEPSGPGIFKQDMEEKGKKKQNCHDDNNDCEGEQMIDRVLKKAGRQRRRQKKNIRSSERGRREEEKEYEEKRGKLIILQ